MLSWVHKLDSLGFSAKLAETEVTYNINAVKSCKNER